MLNSIKLEHNINEIPSHYADRVGRHISQLISDKDKKKHGQFLTPIDISSFISTFSIIDKDSIKILDPGCGVGILSCSLIEYLSTNNKYLKSVELILFEIDKRIIDHLGIVISYLKEWTNKQKIKLEYKIINSDYVLNYAPILESHQNLFENFEKFDIIISNPPYFKLTKTEPHSNAMKSIINGQPNMYAMFLALSAKLLKKDGELIFIIPRSFASGQYFRLFREFFFKNVTLSNVHLFNSRKEAFSRDDVLQENIIIRAIKRNNQTEKKVKISFSNGSKDLSNFKSFTLNEDELIDLKTHQKILHIPTNETEIKIKELIESFKNKFIDLGINISTGPVIPFRHKKVIESNPRLKSDYAPLIWMSNTEKMELNWPINNKNKAQYILINEDSKSLLLPIKNYILLRRFSSKDDSSRLIACPLLKNNFNFDYVGVENHLNYIYGIDNELNMKILFGLLVVLNSKLYDIYFRTFNGNTQVSSTEFRGIKMPDIDKLNKIGTEALLLKKVTQDKIDLLIDNILDLKSNKIIL
ncbi:MAG: hypothetical protein A2X61_07495 [Ignavibacteria bacterium GWB2_35_12]|nr:MAG: hypothetical protein A2X63_12795 [Ignavibacteria bacterium GWA2_35_8]OGU39172.1 MAG: hypothetical protein A2X61_07495 [Ignavibacteria bacterium GWB2_35_12]OGU89200.1 MAG: hypothetical protein A2220_00885 [Ignavibacteria bacterium RIFOXYA2_FULL_35_10]OGV21038.1 MAG: hypothetical protein A2475_00785 [Ignavibacteria bacterium RIFOXYC2_FULL_35_21]